MRSWLEKSPTHAITSRYLQALLDLGASKSEWQQRYEAFSDRQEELARKAFSSDGEEQQR